MMRGKALPHYGKLQVKNLDPEVYRIWLTRNDDLDDLPALDEDPTNSYDMEFEMQDYMRKIWERSNLNNQQCLVFLARVIYGETLEEVGLKIGVTRERVRQIENKAIRKLRQVAWAINESDRVVSLNDKINRKSA